MSEICAECGQSVAWGSGRFVNRVPECNSVIVREEMGRPFPQGDFICSDCDAIHEEDSLNPQ